jgi:ankyrin repeat protein
MPDRDLPVQPHLDHLRNEAKSLRRAFERGADDAVTRVTAVLGARTTLKLTEAQHVIAREYGFASWARLRTHVQASRGLDEAVTAFLDAIEQQNARAAAQLVAAEPRIATVSLAAAAALGDTAAVQQLVAANPQSVHAREGRHPAQPLLWLCFSPFHGESAPRDEGLYESARALLAAGADPNATDDVYHVPALYGVTGMHNVLRIARMLLEAGAKPTDGESVFHAAEKFHEDALELLWEFGVELNHVGDWGNTALYFLLRYHDVAADENVRRGVTWLLEHGADPNVRSTPAQESALHVAVRRRQHPDIVRLLIQHGGDVNARRADGRSVSVLALRSGFDTALLEAAGAEPQPASDEDLLLQACARGDADRAMQLSNPTLLQSMNADDMKLLPDAAARGEMAIVRACLAAGFPVDTQDDNGATAAHVASIEGNAALVAELLRHDPDLARRDPQHHATPMGWAVYGADIARDGNYEETVRALLRAGARWDPNDYTPQHPGVRAVLVEFGLMVDA